MRSLSRVPGDASACSSSSRVNSGRHSRYQEWDRMVIVASGSFMTARNLRVEIQPASFDDIAVIDPAYAMMYLSCPSYGRVKAAICRASRHVPVRHSHDLPNRDGGRCRGAGRENRQRSIDRNFRRDARRNAGAEGARRRAGRRVAHAGTATTPSFPEPSRSLAAAPTPAARPTSSFRSEAVGTDLAALTTIAIGGVFSIKGFSGIRIVDMRCRRSSPTRIPVRNSALRQPRADRRARTGRSSGRSSNRRSACGRTRPQKWCANSSTPTSTSSRTTKS